MFKFLKSLFGSDKQTNQAAGIQIEQVPYKVESPVVENKVAVANDQPIEKVKIDDVKPAVITAAKKPAAKKPVVKKAADKKPATKKAAAKKSNK
jgi:hypothetical protein